MRVSRKLWAIMIGYTLTMILTTIIASPIGFGWLTFYEMGFRIDTIFLGCIVGLLGSVLLGAGELLPIPQRKLMMKDVKTNEQFEDMWKVQMIGGYDGFIAEPFWSGTVLPLTINFISSLNLGALISVIFAILIRWLLHVGAHFAFPSNEHGYRAFGEIFYTAIGLLLLDVISSVAFLISGSVIAPSLIHTLMQPFAQLFGAKEKLRGELKLSKDKVEVVT